MTFENSSTGFNNGYTWNFGDGASVASSTGTGPFTVTYSTSGTKTISLDATNPNGNSSFSQEVVVVDLPEPSFTFTDANGVLTFTNTSLNASGYLWDFGDGNTSSEENPIYTYATSGVFTVTLTAGSDLCPNQTISEEINIVITSTNNLELDIDASVLPNPNQGVFNLKITDIFSRDFQVDLIDLTGRVLENWEVRTSQGDTV